MASSGFRSVLVIASTLEKRWNDAMQRMADLEAELATFERQAMRSVTEEQKQQILQLGRDFPRLWKAKTTSTCDRKRMLRLLVRDVTVVKDPEPRLLRLQICWQGGATEVLEVRQRPRAVQRSLLELLRIVSPKSHTAGYSTARPPISDSRLPECLTP